MLEAGCAVRAGYGQGGGGEDDAGVVGEEGFGEDGGDVDGCGLQVGVVSRGSAIAAGGVAEALGGAAFDPEDGVGVCGFKEELEVVANVGGALAEAGGFFDFAEAFKLPFEALEGVGGPDVGVAAGFEEVGALCEFEAAKMRGAYGQRAEEEAGTLAESGGGALDGGGAGVFGAEHGLGVAGELVETGVGEGDAEVVAGDVFQLVSFVEDDGGGFGEDAGVGSAAGLLLDAEVGEEKMVVDDDDVRLKRLAAHAGDETGLPVGAGLAETDLGTGVELVPKRRVLGKGVNLGSVAGFGGLFPLEDGAELRDFFEAVEDRVVAQSVELLAADIVRSALHVADSQRAEDGFEEGDVFEEELFLEIFGAGGDDDALLLLACPA